MRRRGYVAIEGLPGVGRTALAAALAERLGGRLILDGWGDNPFVPGFCAHPERNALPAQLFFLLTRARQQRLLDQEDLLLPWTFSDYLFERDALFAQTFLDGADYERYLSLAHALGTRRRPDLVLYLDGSARGAPESVTAALAPTLLRFFSRYGEAPVIRVDLSAVDLSGEAGLDALASVLLQERAPSGAFTRMSPNAASEALAPDL